MTFDEFKKKYGTHGASLIVNTYLSNEPPTGAHSEKIAAQVKELIADLTSALKSETAPEILKNEQGDTLCCGAEIEGDTACGKPANLRVNGQARCHKHAGMINTYVFSFTDTGRTIIVCERTRTHAGMLLNDYDSTLRAEPGTVKEIAAKGEKPGVVFDSERTL